MEEKLREARRYTGSHRTRVNAENRRRDPSLCLISTQILICIILALIGWVAVKTDQPFLIGARERYEELLTGEFDAQTAKETAAQVIERLAEPRGATSAAGTVTPDLSGARAAESASLKVGAAGTVTPDLSGARAAESALLKGGAAGVAVRSSADAYAATTYADSSATLVTASASTGADSSATLVTASASTGADISDLPDAMLGFAANDTANANLPDAFMPPITDTDTDEPAAKSGGAGGRMLTALTSPSGGEGQPAPASCSFAPIVVSARVEPPCGGTVSSEYGYRKHPISGADDFHRGVDIATAQGDAVRASLPGRVSEISSSAIYGNFITLDHGGGLFTTYSHCDAIIAKLGANMRQGEMIATVGNTGISTGPHVHFEISRDGKYYNPAWLFDRMSADGD